MASAEIENPVVPHPHALVIQCLARAITLFGDNHHVASNDYKCFVSSHRFSSDHPDSLAWRRFVSALSPNAKVYERFMSCAFKCITLPRQKNRPRVLLFHEVILRHAALEDAISRVLQFNSNEPKLYPFFTYRKQTTLCVIMTFRVPSSYCAARRVSIRFSASSSAFDTSSDWLCQSIICIPPLAA